ncbi:hypothetical protein HUJ05_005703 [Dendroctonus ponderosae]|nr:hypothetical protein HUJ05_005703 [Dendroctonus ponderosae]
MFISSANVVAGNELIQDIVEQILQVQVMGFTNVQINRLIAQILAQQLKVHRHTRRDGLIDPVQMSDLQTMNLPQITFDYATTYFSLIWGVK